MFDSTDIEFKTPLEGLSDEATALIKKLRKRLNKELVKFRGELRAGKKKDVDACNTIIDESVIPFDGEKSDKTMEAYKEVYRKIIENLLVMKKAELIKREGVFVEKLLKRKTFNRKALVKPEPALEEKKEDIHWKDRRFNFPEEGLASA